MMEQFKEIDIESTANFKMMVNMRDALAEKEEFSFEYASELVSKMKIEVNDNFYSDVELRKEVIDTYVSLIAKLKNSADSAGFPNYLMNKVNDVTVEFNL